MGELHPQDVPFGVDPRKVVDTSPDTGPLVAVCSLFRNSRETLANLALEGGLATGADDILGCESYRVRRHDLIGQLVASNVGSCVPCKREIFDAGGRFRGMLWKRQRYELERVEIDCPPAQDALCAGVAEDLASEVTLEFGSMQYTDAQPVFAPAHAIARRHRPGHPYRIRVSLASDARKSVALIVEDLAVAAKR